jgi:hypothetical protein
MQISFAFDFTFTFHQFSRLPDNSSRAHQHRPDVPVNPLERSDLSIRSNMSFLKYACTDFVHNQIDFYRN